VIYFDTNNNQIISECDNVIIEFDRSFSVYWKMEKFYEKLISLIEFMEYYV